MTDQWFYTSAGQQCGPVSTDELRRQAAAGALRPEDLVWCEGMPRWTPARQLGDLLAADNQLTAAPPPAPSPLERWGRPERAEANAPHPFAQPARLPRIPEEPYPQPRARRAADGGNGLKLVAGLGLAAVGAVVAGILVAVLGAAANDPGHVRSFSIRAGETITYSVELSAGQRTRVWVTSSQNTDIDLFVWDPMGQLISKDEFDHKDCFVEFYPSVAGTYRLEARNINIHSKLPVGSNQCKMQIDPPAKMSRN